MTDGIASVSSDGNRCLNLEKQIKFLLYNNLTEALGSLGQYVFISRANFCLFLEYFANISMLRLGSTSALGFTANLRKNIGSGRLRANIQFPQIYFSLCAQRFPLANQLKHYHLVAICMV